MTLTNLEPKQLAAKLGITPKRLRALLRTKYPRQLETKGKRWEIPPQLADKVVKEYKEAKVKQEADKKAAIAAQLAGEKEKEKEGGK